MKISRNLVDKIISEKCTSKEIDVILYLAQFQDLSGFVPNVYYKDVAEAVGINKSTVYRIYERLEQKDILKLSESSRVRCGFINVKIRYSDYSKVNFKDKGKLLSLGLNYIDINKDIFFCDSYRSLPPSEKYLIFRLFLNKGNRDKAVISEETIGRYLSGDFAHSAILNKSRIVDKSKDDMNRKYYPRHIIKRVVHSLKSFKIFGDLVFDIFERQEKWGNIYEFKFISTQSRKETIREEFLEFTGVHNLSALRRFQEHMYLNFFKLHKITVTPEAVGSIIQMDNEYSKTHKLSLYRKTVASISRKYKSVEPALIRSIMLQSKSSPNYAEKYFTIY